MKFDPMKLSPRKRALLAWSPVLLFLALCASFPTFIIARAWAAGDRIVWFTHFGKTAPRSSWYKYVRMYNREGPQPILSSEAYNFGQVRMTVLHTSDKRLFFMIGHPVKGWNVDYESTIATNKERFLALWEQRRLKVERTEQQESK